MIMPILTLLSEAERSHLSCSISDGGQIESSTGLSFSVVSVSVSLHCMRLVRFVYRLFHIQHLGKTQTVQQQKIQVEGDFTHPQSMGNVDYIQIIQPITGPFFTQN